MRSVAYTDCTDCNGGGGGLSMLKQGLKLASYNLY